MRTQSAPTLTKRAPRKVFTHYVQGCGMAAIYHAKFVRDLKRAAVGQTTALELYNALIEVVNSSDDRTTRNIRVKFGHTNQTRDCEVSVYDSAGYILTFTHITKDAELALRHGAQRKRA